MTSTIHLFVGDATDAPTIKRLIANLPDDAYGQAFIEVATSRQIQDWITAPGVSVTWLPRDGFTSTNPTMAPRGERAARALQSWIDEWLPVSERRIDDVSELFSHDPFEAFVNERVSHQRRGTSELSPYECVAWVGCAASQQVNELCHTLNARIDIAHHH